MAEGVTEMEAVAIEEISRSGSPTVLAAEEKKTDGNSIKEVIMEKGIDIIDVEIQGTDSVPANVFTKEFLEWKSNRDMVENSRRDKLKSGKGFVINAQPKKRSYTITKDQSDLLSKSERISRMLTMYENAEEKVLDKLEVLLSYMDNFVAFQALFPSIERKTKGMKLFKPINFMIRQVARIYIIMILIYLKRYLLRLRKINKLLKIVKVEFSIIKNNFVINKKMNANNVDFTSYHEKCLKVLYMEKLKAIVEIIGYFNDLVLNLSLVTKKVMLGKVVGRFVGLISWVVNIYRLCKDEKEETKNELVIKELEVRFGM